MYTVDELDVVVELAEVPKPSASVPSPIVVGDEACVVLSYGLPNHDQRGTFAIVRFEMPYVHLFGPPNDEALPGHPLWGRGLGYYSVYEVLSSSLNRHLERMNSVHPRHDPTRFAGRHHYIFTFHDSTFECVARGMNTWIESPARDERLTRMVHYLPTKQ